MVVTIHVWLIGNAGTLILVRWLNNVIFRNYCYGADKSTKFFVCVSQVIISDYGRLENFCAGQNGRCINMKILLIME